MESLGLGLSIDTENIKDPKFRLRYSYDRRTMPAFIFCRSLNLYYEIIQRLNNYSIESN